MSAVELAAAMAAAETAIASAREAYRNARRELDRAMRSDVRAERLHMVSTQDLYAYLSLAEESPVANASLILPIRVSLGMRGL